MPTEQFGDVAQFLALNRAGLTVFAHAETGDDRADHTDHVIWFGPSETLDLCRSSMWALGMRPLTKSS